MIEQTTVDGRPALVSYVNQSMEPIDRAAATLVKVTFTDEEGGTMFLVPAPPNGA